MIDSARDELARRTGDLLVRERLADSPVTDAYSTPRRLAVLARGVAARQPDVQEQLTGPSLKVAYNDGAPTQAAEAFARKAGVPVGSLEEDHDTQGRIPRSNGSEERTISLRHSRELLPKEIAGIYWAKEHVLARQELRALCPSRALDGVASLRPVVPVEFGGITAGRHQ